MKKNWTISGSDGMAITATATSAATQIAALGSYQEVAEDVMIDNPGPLDVYVKAGDDNTITATLTSVRVPANSMQPFCKGQGNNWLAVRTLSGSQAITVHCGDGQ